MLNKTIFRAFLLIVLLSSITTQAQEHMLYSMRRLPQAIDANPAFQPLSNTFIGLPLISSNAISINNSGFSINDFNNRGSLKDVADVLWSFNSLRVNQSTDILRFGGRFFDTYHSFNISIRNKVALSYPEDAIQMIAYGNFDYDSNIAQSYNLSNLRFTSFSFLEIGYSNSERVTKKFAIGYKLKLLKGFFGADVSFLGTEINTLSSNQTPIKGIEVNLGLEARLSGLSSKYIVDKEIPADKEENASVSTRTTNLENYQNPLASRNFGGAVDLGITYKIKKDVELSASLIDVGGIFWANGSQIITGKGNFQWDGISKDDYFGKNAKGFASISQENIEKFNFDTKEEAFFTLMPIDLNAAIEFQESKNLQWGSLLKLSHFNGTTIPQLSFYGTYTVYKHLSLMANYGIMNHSLSNFGFGFDLKLGPVQVYMLTDNIFAGANLYGTRSAGVHFGINLLFNSYVPSIEEEISGFDESMTEDRLRKASQRR